MRRLLVLAFLGAAVLAGQSNLGSAVSDLSPPWTRLQMSLTGAVPGTVTGTPVVSARGISANPQLTVDSEIDSVCAIHRRNITPGKSPCPNIDGRGYNTAPGGDVTPRRNGALNSGAAVIENAPGPSLIKMAAAPAHDVNAYDFPAQSPASPASLIAGPNRVTLAPCPLGVAGTDASHYLYVAGTGTPEPALISGGTCTSGAASGTVIVTTSGTHPAGYTIRSATAGSQEAFNVAAATSGPISLAWPVAGSPYQVYAPVNLLGKSHVVLDFQGSTIALNATNRTFSWITSSAGEVSNGTTVTSDVNHPNREQSVAASFTVASSSGFAAEDYLLLCGTENGRRFCQVGQVKTIAGATITPYDVVRVPLQTTDANSVQKLAPMGANLVIRNLVMDGTNAGGPNGSYAGIRITDYRDVLLENIRISNIAGPSQCDAVTGGTCKNSSGIATAYGLRHTYHNIWIDSVGAGGGAAFYPYYCTDCSASNFHIRRSSFGFEPVYGSNWQFTNIDAKENRGRAVKLQSVAYCQGSNIDVSNSYTGISAMGGTYNCQLSNVTSTYTTHGPGVWTSGEDNRNNVFRGIFAIGAQDGGCDIVGHARDRNNIFLDILSLNSITCNAGTHLQTFAFAGKPAASAYAAGAQSMPHAAFTAITFDTSEGDNGVHSTSRHPSRFITFAPGFVSFTCSVAFASNSVGERGAEIRLNAATLLAADNRAAVDENTTAINISALANLAKGDYLELYAYQNSGGPLDTVGGGSTRCAISAR